MCRNIKPLFNYDPPATDTEIWDASLQFVRKISGFVKPSKINETTFNRTVDKVASNVENLLNSLETDAKPRDREVEAERARERSIKRFGIKSNE